MIITIGRQHGSNGHDIARALAKALDINCYDKEIVDHAAESSNFSREIFGSYDEKRVSSYIVPTPHYIGMNEGFRLNMQVASAQFDAIRSLADRGDGIFVGRCADSVLSERKDVFNVFIYADQGTRLKRAMERYNLSEKEALKSIQQTDKYRASYYNMNSSKKWGMKESYHIMLDSGMLGIDGIVDILEKIYREKTE